VLTDEEGVDLSVHMDDVAIAALLARHTTTTLEPILFTTISILAARVS